MSDAFQTISPVDGSVYCERPYAPEPAVADALETAAAAQRGWAELSIAVRAEVLSRMVDAVLADTPRLCDELSWQMGRPIAQAPGEFGGFEERARHMIEIAAEALADIVPAGKPGFRRFIRREPMGTVFVVAPWNYPWLTSVNAVIPALLAGNAVIMKPSSQTPLVGEAYARAAEAAGLPAGLFQSLYLTHGQAERVISDGAIDFVAFTGSVDGGAAVERAAAGRFLGLGLELGGKDPAYVRADADVARAADGVADGAFFNAGQSCCGIERAYVHADVYDDFVDALVGHVSALRLGTPLDETTTLGPMVRGRAADQVRAQVAEAVQAGAKGIVDAAAFNAAGGDGSPYLAPQVLVDVDHTMRVMTEESFGPVLGVMKVTEDDEAVDLMNDSEYGLTASIWTRDENAAEALGQRLRTGTVFMNRADYLDPALAWTGVKNSGRGVTLSELGLQQLTQPKSYHLKTGG